MTTLVYQSYFNVPRPQVKSLIPFVEYSAAPVRQITREYSALQHRMTFAVFDRTPPWGWVPVS